MSRWSSGMRVLLQGNRRFCAALCALLLVPFAAGADIPEWVRSATREPLPPYASGAKAVVLLSERTLTVRADGQLYERHRRVAKILQNAGRSEGSHRVWTDRDTKIISMKAWCVSAEGKEYALKEKDALDRTPFTYAVYEDWRFKEFTVPAAEPGSYVAFEYEQRVRPYVRQQTWWFQEEIPVIKAVFQLNLAAGWEFSARSVNWQDIKPTSGGANSWTLEVKDVPAVVPERQMPALHSVTGRVNVSFFAPGSSEPGMRMASWSDVSSWADNLNAPQRQSSPAMKEKVAALAREQSSLLDKIRAVSMFVQRDIRYVAIEIGIGGFQAHAADATFSNKYGDCKDKATLLATMLQELGVKSHMLLVNTERGVANPTAPSSYSFNHAILGIELPRDVTVPQGYPLIQHPTFGNLLVFDPTDQYTPFGQVHPYLHSNHVLVVAKEGGELIRVPALSPSLTQLKRSGKFELLPDGTLTGEIEEVRTGYEAWKLRGRLLYSEGHQSTSVFEELLARHLNHARLQSASIDNLNNPDDPLVLRYRFTAPSYASASGDLLFVKLQVVGTKTNSIAEEKNRQYPLIFTDTVALHTDEFEIKLPQGFVLEDVPRPVNAESPFAAYMSKIEAKENLLRYSRSYTVKEVVVPLEQLSDLKDFMRQVSSDERMLAVLKRSATSN